MVATAPTSVPAPAKRPRRAADSDSTVTVGRSRAGIAFGENQQRADLIFVIGVPGRLLSDYLVCVGTLARLVKDATIRSRLLNAETPREFIEALTAENL